MRVFVSRLICISIHLFARLFFRIQARQLNPSPDFWRDTKIFVLLNHTSLYEPLLFGGIPITALWNHAGNALVPGADKTLNRPIVRKFFRLLSTQMTSITRRRDSSWETFLDLVRERKKDSMVAMAPEGRMLRPSGLDSQGKPMTIRGGIADVLKIIYPEGQMVIAYSGGLHHVQAPGQLFPRLFKRIDVAFEVLRIEDYCQQLGIEKSSEQFRLAVVADLERRKLRNTPHRPPDTLPSS